MSLTSEQIESFQETEMQLLEILEKLRESYVTTAEPYIRRLNMVRTLLNPPSITITREQAVALGVLSQ